MNAMTALAASPGRCDAVPVLQRKCACGGSASPLTGECEECQRKRALGLQTRRAAGGAPGGGTPAARSTPAAVAQGLGSPGVRLGGAVRSFFEARFGQDFGNIRIHADAGAAASARALGAEAYTCGSDVVFGPGHYDVASPRGLRLMAHELTHVVQQRSGLRAERASASNATERGSASASDAAEREAEGNAARLATGEPLRFAERAPAVARRAADETTTTVAEPASPPGCTLAQHHAIEPAVRRAEQRLGTAIARVDAYIAAPADPGNGAVRAALDRHFHSTDPSVVARVRARLETIRTDMTTRDPFTVECHDATDSSCTNANAYVFDSNLLVLCPDFFGASAEFRTGSLIHEMAHALTGLHITDRAYSTDRLLPYLTTAEALDNAESYQMFAREVESGKAVTGSPPRDDIDDCTARTQPLIREALARAERWNRDSETVANDQSAALLTASAPFFTTHLGDATPATRTAARRLFNAMVIRLKSPLDVRCDNTAASECSTTRRAYRGSASNVGRGLALGAKIGTGLGVAGGLGAGVAAALGSGPLVGLGLFGLATLGGLLLGSLIGLIVGAVTRHPEVHVCPDWAALATVEDRTESLLAAIYETYGDVDAAHARRYAALARALHANWWRAPPP